MSIVLTLDPLLPGPFDLLRPWAMSMQCQRFAVTGGNTQTKVTSDSNVLDPNGIATDANHLRDAIRGNDGLRPVVVMAHSRGAQVVGHWLAEHAEDTDVPGPEVLSFVLIGNPERGTAHGARGGQRYLDGSPLRDTPNNARYTVLDVARRGDYFGQPVPDVNSFMAQWIHCWYLGVDLHDPHALHSDVVGNTTYLVVP